MNFLVSAWNLTKILTKGQKHMFFGYFVRTNTKNLISEGIFKDSLEIIWVKNISNMIEVINCSDSWYFEQHYVKICINCQFLKSLYSSGIFWEGEGSFENCSICSFKRVQMIRKSVWLIIQIGLKMFWNHVMFEKSLKYFLLVRFRRSNLTKCPKSDLFYLWQGF